MRTFHCCDDDAPKTVIAPDGKVWNLSTMNDKKIYKSKAEMAISVTGHKIEYERKNSKSEPEKPFF